MVQDALSLLRVAQKGEFAEKLAQGFVHALVLEVEKAEKLLSDEMVEIVPVRGRENCSKGMRKTPLLHYYFILLIL